MESEPSNDPTKFAITVEIRCKIVRRNVKEVLRGFFFFFFFIGKIEFSRSAAVKGKLVLSILIETLFCCNDVEMLLYV